MSRKKSKKKKNLKVKSSEVVEDSEKRQYHIGLAPGEVANTVLIVGDPERAIKISKLLDTNSIIIKKQNREFLTFTGTYKKLPISIIATGIGPSNIEILLVELSHIFPSNLTNRPVIIRIGSSGSLQEDIHIGDLVISTGAVRLEDTSLYFVDQSYPSVADYEIVTALITSAEQGNFIYHTGITASASGFYGAQGREIPNFPVNENDLPDNLGKRKVLNFEMESSTLFTLSSLGNFRSGTVCAVYANRPKGEFIDESRKSTVEHDVIMCGMQAALIINNMDKVKAANNKSRWNANLHL